MAAKSETIDRKIDGDPKQGAGTAGPGSSAGDSSTKTAGAGKTGRAGTAVGGGSAGAGGKTGKAETETRPELLDVEETKAPAPEPKKAPVKRKRKPAKKKPEPMAFSGNQIAAIITSVSTICAARPGMEVWALSPEEAQQIADPLAAMIAKNEQLSKLGEHGDAIALVTACIVIFLPRAMVYAGQRKNTKKNRVERVVKKNDTAGAPTGNDRKPTGQPAKRPADNNDKSIFSVLPPVIG